jgi:glc operon protein GlcG
MRTKPCLTSADAQKMMAACKAEAEKNKWKVSIAIVDDAGVLLHLERMEGAGPTTPEVAHGKARTAALTKQPTKLWEERVKERPAFLNYPAGLSIWGGVPIIYQNECVGAIGVSGVQSQDDEKIASAGVAALEV